LATYTRPLERDALHTATGDEPFHNEPSMSFEKTRSPSSVSKAWRRPSDAR